MRSTTESLMVPSSHPTRISPFAQDHPFSSQVGSNSWLEHPLDIPSIFEIVFLEVRCFLGVTWMGSTPFAWHLN
jgi:hypothetical protein